MEKTIIKEYLIFYNTLNRPKLTKLKKKDVDHLVSPPLNNFYENHY